MGDRAIIIIIVMVMLFTWAATWAYYGMKLTGAEETLAEAMIENAKLKVAMEAAGMTEEGKKVYALTLAALNTAYPKEPVSAEEAPPSSQEVFSND